jgi:hypothetical protein
VAALHLQLDGNIVTVPMPICSLTQQVMKPSIEQGRSDHQDFRIDGEGW